MLKRTILPVPLLAVLLFAVVLLVASEWLGLREAGMAARLRDLLAEHPFAGLWAFSLLFALGNLAQIPGVLFLVAAVWAFGTLWGGAITYVAAVFSCATGFWVVRRIGGNALRQIDGTLARRIFAQLDRHPLLALVVLRLLLQTAPALNYSLALSGVRARDNLIGTLIGLPLPIAVYCLFFDALVRLAGVAA